MKTTIFLAFEYIMLKKKHTIFLAIIIAFLILHFYNVTALVAVAAIAYLFKDEIFGTTPPPAEIHEIKICDKAAAADVQPLDIFNTYDSAFMDPEEGKRAMYRAATEYPSTYTDEINPVYDVKRPPTADEMCAQMSHQMQLRSRESIDNRARLNVNTFRPYFEEDLVTNENAPWWGDNPELML